MQGTVCNLKTIKKIIIQFLKKCLVIVYININKTTC